MSITDELREWWVCKFPVMDSELHKDFSAIADRMEFKPDLRHRDGNEEFMLCAKCANATFGLLDGMEDA